MGRAPRTLVFRPLTRECWPDFEALFGPKGACGGCWCMYWRLARKDFTAGKHDGNRRAMKALVRRGEEPGILAYARAEDGRERAVGWCALAPREDYPVLARSRVMRSIDERPVWSVSCLFVERSHRGRGVATALLRAAAEHARAHGASCLEGYPVEPRDERPVPAAFAWTGVPAAFERAGFREVARHAPARPIMRRELRGRSRRARPARKA